ncbi:thiol-disulfide oxidoreductase DCC family protein [Pantoea allii]|uniref:thiol-disulfide oxidoreductase DCC family protein n=2 Tax=Pantoea allii TaxID=574096 RepID=UPI003D316D2D
MPQPPYLQTGESVVLYDGVCKLCTGWVSFLLRHRLAQQVRFAAVQSEQGKALLKWAGLPEDNINTIVYIRGDRHWLRAQAVLRVMQQLPMPWRALSMLRWFPPRISNFFYDCIALNRYRWFGRHTAQQAIQADYPGRFLPPHP